MKLKERGSRTQPSTKKVDLVGPRPGANCVTNTANESSEKGTKAVISGFTTYNTETAYESEERGRIFAKVADESIDDIMSATCLYGAEKSATDLSAKRGTNPEDVMRFPAKKTYKTALNINFENDAAPTVGNKNYFEARGTTGYRVSDRHIPNNEVESDDPPLNTSKENNK